MYVKSVTLSVLHHKYPFHSLHIRFILRFPFMLIQSIKLHSIHPLRNPYYLRISVKLLNSESVAEVRKSFCRGLYGLDVWNSDFHPQSKCLTEFGFRMEIRMVSLIFFRNPYHGLKVGRHIVLHNL